MKILYPLAWIQSQRTQQSVQAELFCCFKTLGASWLPDGRTPRVSSPRVKIAAIRRNSFYGKWSRATGGRAWPGRAGPGRARPNLFLSGPAGDTDRRTGLGLGRVAEIETSATLASTAIDIRRNSRGRRARLAVWLDCLLDTAPAGDERTASTDRQTTQHVVVRVSVQRAIIARL